jgi:hypothetical protein
MTKITADHLSRGTCCIFRLGGRRTPSSWPLRRRAAHYRPSSQVTVPLTPEESLLWPFCWFNAPELRRDRCRNARQYTQASVPPIQLPCC